MMREAYGHHPVWRVVHLRRHPRFHAEHRLSTQLLSTTKHKVSRSPGRLNQLSRSQGRIARRKLDRPAPPHRSKIKQDKSIMLPSCAQTHTRTGHEINYATDETITILQYNALRTETDERQPCERPPPSFLTRPIPTLLRPHSAFHALRKQQSVTPLYLEGQESRFLNPTQRRCFVAKPATPQQEHCLQPHDNESPPGPQ